MRPFCNSRRAARTTALLRAQPVGEALAKLGELGRHDREAIGAALAFAVPIGLMIILGRIPVRKGFDRGDDRCRPVRLVARDRRACGLFLRGVQRKDGAAILRSEEHTSELQSLMRISYAVFCLKKKKKMNKVSKGTTLIAIASKRE